MKNQSTLIVTALRFTLFSLTFLPAIAWAQSGNQGGRIAQKVISFQQKGSFTNETSIFSVVTDSKVGNTVAKTVKQFTLLDIHDVSTVLETKPAFLNFTVPVENGRRSIRVLLYKESISPNGFTLLSSDGKKYEAPDIVHYKGSIDGDMNSVAAFSFSQNEVSGMINNKDGNYVIGKIQDHSGKHIIYNDKDVIDIHLFDCGANTAIPLSPGNYYRGTESTTALTTKCVNWYWETDYDLYVAKQNNVATVTTYMQDVFNQVSTLYANDGVSITLKTLFVWSTIDPYTGPSTSEYLDQFGVNRTSFNGDLAALMGTQGGGGIAWINGLCNSQTKYKMAYCGISTGFSNVPSFSWTIECITHEQGHLLGSRHTHDCVWNGNNTKIDGCGDNAGYPSGSCANPGDPAGGGTIMSYCHLRNVGINFNLGFGPQPKAVIVNTVNNASCLTTCSTGCTVPNQPGTISGSAAVCASTTQTYSVTAVAGATGYVWTLPSGWSGASTTNSISVTTSGTSGNVSVTATNTCGNGTARTLAVTATSAPAQPGTISGNAAVCAGTAQAYSVAAVSGATSYTWTLPSGWAGTSATNSISTTSGAAGGTISVKANNGCGSSALRTLTASITASTPSQPGTISGSTAVCSAATQTYSVSAVSGASSYSWTLPSGWSGASTTNSITVTAGSAGGTISVTATNGCGTSAARTLAVSISSGSAPAKPSAITVSGGSARVCPGDTRTYNVTAVSGITYNWIAPAGGNITSGQGTAAISITYNANLIANGTLSVTAGSGCGTSAARTLTIARNVPASSAAINGPATICTGSVGTYTATPVTGATSYQWTIPAGGTLQGAANGNTINILWGASGGNLAVRAINNCGTGGSRSLKITISCTGGLAAGTATPSINKAEVYPNPTDDIANLKFFSKNNTIYTLSITDIAGRTLLTEKHQSFTGINIHKFNLSAFAKGTYFILIESSNTKEVLKINVQ